MKKPELSLIGHLIGLARAAEGNEDILTPESHRLILDCLLASEDEMEKLLGKIENEKRRLIPNCFGCSAPCGKNSSYDMSKLKSEPQDLQDMKLRIISVLQDMAKAGLSDDKHIRYILKALYFIGLDSWTAQGLEPLLLEAESLLREA